jgi:hypothetical protein
MGESHQFSDHDATPDEAADNKPAHAANISPQHRLRSFFSPCLEYLPTDENGDSGLRRRIFVVPWRAQNGGWNLAVKFLQRLRGERVEVK